MSSDYEFSDEDNEYYDEDEEMRDGDEDGESLSPRRYLTSTRTCRRIVNADLPFCRMVLVRVET